MWGHCIKVDREFAYCERCPWREELISFDWGDAWDSLEDLDPAR